MVDWVKGFFLPIVELTFIGGFAIAVSWIVGRGVWKYWTKEWKWFFKYSIFKNKYDPKIVQWSMDAMERDMDYYDAKKFLMIKGVPMMQIKETMWIYNRVSKEMKGGMNYGQRIARSNRKAQSTEATDYSF